MASRFPDTPATTTANTQIANTFALIDGTTEKDIINGATNDTLVLDLVATSDDTSAVVLNLFLYDGGAARLIGAVNVPTLAGTNGVEPSVSLLNTTDIPGLAKRDDQGITLASGQKLQVAPQAAVTAAKTVTVTALAMNYSASA